MAEHGSEALQQALWDPQGAGKRLIPGWSRYCLNPNNTHYYGAEDITTGKKTASGERRRSAPGSQGESPGEEAYCTDYAGCQGLYELSPSELMGYTEGCIDKVVQASVCCDLASDPCTLSMLSLVNANLALNRACGTVADRT